jgi:tRNA pseudouridine55 synthase
VDGILLVDKSEGITSAGVVRALKPRVGGRKIGHLGTLDPFASGLLPLCIGEATKIAQFLSAEDKTYTGRIRLGIETDSLDRTGRVMAHAPVPPLDSATVEAIRRRFLGTSWQTPPMYSAVKREGVPLYKLARRGIEVERVPRRIEVRALTLEIVDASELRFEVACSKGTYVRVLGADIGRALGCGAHLVALRRTRFGAFDVRAAHPLATLERWTEPTLPLIPLQDALGRLRAFVLPPDALALLRRGQQDPLERLDPPADAHEVAKVVNAAGEVVAIVTAADARRGWRLARIVDPAAERGTPPDATRDLYKPRTLC